VSRRRTRAGPGVRTGRAYTGACEGRFPSDRWVKVTVRASEQIRDGHLAVPMMTCDVDGVHKRLTEACQRGSAGGV
jgi:hypothetical protein